MKPMTQSAVSASTMFLDRDSTHEVAGTGSGGL